MARKNMFEGIAPAKEASSEPARPAPRGPELFQQAGPIAAIRNDLRNLSSRSVQEIAPEMIEDTGLKDRLGDIEADVEELRESIRKHGQQVPILLRPHPRLSGRYQVVYGRRRLAALKGLGLPVKALIRSLTDEEAVLAQGQENNLRKDPSFIEKTLFAGELEQAGYEPRVIQDALNVSRSHTSHMRKVREAFSRDVIERIGAAPSIGWKRWYDCAVRLSDSGLEASAIHPEAFPEDSLSDQRFALWSAALDRALSKPRSPSAAAPNQAVTDGNGAALGTLTRKGPLVTFRAERRMQGFADWLEANGASAFADLYAAYLDDAKADERVNPKKTQQKGAVTE